MRVTNTLCVQHSAASAFDIKTILSGRNVLLAELDRAASFFKSNLGYRVWINVNNVLFSIGIIGYGVQL